MLFKTSLFSLLSVAAATLDVSCAPQIPPASCSALATGGLLSPRGNVKVDCNVVKGALGLLKGLGAPASSFCKSYLRVPCTTTVPATVTPGPSTVDVIVTIVTTTTVYGNANFPKRGEIAPMAAPVHDLKARTIPKGLDKFAVAEISSACACLKISPSKTVTRTITAPAPLTTQTGTTTLIATITTCAPQGGPCDCLDPGRCCNQACICSNQGNAVSTCL